MRRDDDYREDILIAARAIATYVAGLSEASLAADPRTRDAIIRQLEIIGEAARQLSDEFKAEHDDVPWRDVIGMRNVLIHDYHNVAIRHIWVAAKVDVPELVRLLG
jgi:uncharacterized protein with HEPN domain